MIPFHPIADIFPLMEGQEFAELCESIRKNKLREPITLFEGKVLDGRNRERACEATGVEPRYRDFEGTYEQAVQFVWDMNFHRRHMTNEQKRVALEKRLELYPNQTDREIAKATGFSPPTVAKVRNVKNLHRTERIEASGRKARGTKPKAANQKKPDKAAKQPSAKSPSKSSAGQVVISAEQRKAEAARAELIEQQLDNACSNENLGAKESAEVTDSAGAVSGAEPAEAPAANGPLDIPGLLLKTQYSTANEVPAESEVPAASNDPAETEASASVADLVEFAQAIQAKAAELGSQEIAALDVAIILGVLEIAKQLIEQMETSEAA
jgi:hypothetical protein